jgi:hypothetical protein
MLINYTRNPFKNIRRGHLVFYKFAFAHLSFLKANNPNKVYDALIARLESLLTPYDAWIAAQDQSTIDQSGETDAVELIIDQFVLFVTKDLSEDVHYLFKKQPKVIHQLYAHGNADYHSITKANAETLIKRVSDFCTEHKAVLDKETEVQATKFLTDYLAARKAQEENKGIVSAGSDTGAALRSAVEDYMHPILLNIVLQNLQMLRNVLSYYDTSIVTSKTKTPPVVPPPPAS